MLGRALLWSSAVRDSNLIHFLSKSANCSSQSSRCPCSVSALQKTSVPYTVLALQMEHKHSGLGLSHTPIQLFSLLLQEHGREGSNLIGS